MQVDVMLRSGRRRDLEQEARALEAAGFAGLWYPEVRHDPFLALAATVPATSTARLGTAVAIAFARSPMTLALAARDLQEQADGRFLLGLGSQVKAHVERRYSMPWGRPAARMREYVSAVRAIWAAWRTGERLDFAGEFYTHTLMTPFFSPGPTDLPDPPILLAAVGAAMTRVAGEVADGLVVHAFTTPRYLREVTLPALDQGLAATGRSRHDITLCYPGLVATGRDEAQLARSVADVRAQVAFYASTPAYRGVLAAHGWADLGEALHALSTSPRPDRWAAMNELVDDEVLAQFAVVGSPQQVAGELRSRYAGLVDRFLVSVPTGPGRDEPGGVDVDLLAPLAAAR